MTFQSPDDGRLYDIKETSGSLHLKIISQISKKLFDTKRAYDAQGLYKSNSRKICNIDFFLNVVSKL